MRIDKRRELVSSKTVFISCVIPVFNEAEVIDKFLESLEQFLPTLTNHFEIIIVDHDEVPTIEKQLRQKEQARIQREVLEAQQRQQKAKPKPERKKL